jgi:Flp pilus assembly pilin Flp
MELPLGGQRLFVHLWHDKAGSSLIEYSILVAIIVAAIISGLVAAGLAASGIWVRLLNILG